jgi:DNA polymerase-3 subunit epsilon
MNFVAIDFETANYSRESACAVGLVKFEDGKKTDSFYSLVRPPVLYVLPEFTDDIHGITVDDIRDAPTFAQLWETVRQFIADFPLAAHNAQFDMGILEAVLHRYELKIPPLRYFCTCNLARRAWPGLKSHALAFLGGHFGIVYSAHHALDDAETCGKIALLAAEKFGAKNVAETLKAAGLRKKKLGVR